jgi:hypothetical protein
MKTEQLMTRAGATPVISGVALARGGQAGESNGEGEGDALRVDAGVVGRLNLS